MHTDIFIEDSSNTMNKIFGIEEAKKIINKLIHDISRIPIDNNIADGSSIIIISDGYINKDNKAID